MIRLTQHPRESGTRLLAAVVLLATVLVACTDGQAVPESPPTSVPTPSDIPPTSVPAPSDTPTTEPTETPADDSPQTGAEIVDITWRWERFEDTGGGDDIVVDDPSSYTLTLLPEGTYRAKADCNDASGGYTLDGNNLTLGPGPVTLAECAPGSLYDEYLAWLGGVASYALEGDKLLLSVTDAGTIHFARVDDETGGALDPQTLANMEYESMFTQSGSAPLVDSEYREPAAPGSATEIVVLLTEHVTFGQLGDGQRVAAAILVTNPGGSGTFYDLALVAEQDGQPVNIATTLLGDRVQINRLVIKNGELVVDMIASGPDDPMCCPTQEVERTYSLQGSEMVQTGEVIHSSEDVPTGTGGDLTDILWQWAELVETAPASQSVVPDPEHYTLVLRPDGNLAIKADCNVVGGSYALEGDALTIELGPTTMAFCGEQSLDQQYLELLGNIDGYAVEGDRLVLDLKAGGGRMTFDSGGPAPSAEAPDQPTLAGRWKWLETSGVDGTLTVDDPGKYVVEFKPDGTVAIQADCNNAGGAFETDGSSLGIEIGPMTLAECAPGSLYNEFIQQLGTADSYVVQADTLTLTLAAGGGSMKLIRV